MHDKCAMLQRSPNRLAWMKRVLRKHRHLQPVFSPPSLPLRQMPIQALLVLCLTTQHPWYSVYSCRKQPPNLQLRATHFPCGRTDPPSLCLMCHDAASGLGRSRL